MLSRLPYGIFLNPVIVLEVVNNSDLVFNASHSNKDFPFLNFFNLIFLPDGFVFEYYPILFPKSIPNKIIFFALK